MEPFKLPGLDCNMTTIGWQCSKELKLWTHALGARHKYPLLGRMLSLQKVVVNPAMLQAAMPYWDPLRGEFRFGNICMCPTYEEIQHILGLSKYSSGSTIAVPLPEDSYSKYISKFLNLRGQEPYVKPYEVEDLKLSYSYMYQEVRRKLPQIGQKVNEEELEIHQRRYMACFFGEVLFGRTSDSMNPIIVKAVESFVKKQNIAPLVLGELIRNLNKGEEFAGSTIILYIWLCEHMPVPLERRRDLVDWRSFYEDGQKIPGTAKMLCDSWAQLQSTDVTWRMTGVVERFVVGHQGPDEMFQTDLVVLPTFGEIVGYRPLRFVRQFGYIQDQPYSRRTAFGVKRIQTNKPDIFLKFQKKWGALYYSDKMHMPYTLIACYEARTTPDYDFWITN